MSASVFVESLTWSTERARRAAVASRRSSFRIRCSKCRRMIFESRQRQHAETCEAVKRIPLGHQVCKCGGLMRRDARCCFACESRDPVFAVLDRLIADGVTMSRAEWEKRA